MLRVLKAFFPAVLLTYVLASLFSTHIIVGNLQGLGVAVPLAEYLQWALRDLQGLLTSYLPLILVAFVLALPVAAGLTRLMPGQRLFLFVLAGCVGIIALHVIMKAVLGINGIAAVRTMGGLIAQGVAGAAGGLLYYRLSRLSSDEAS